ncbi:Crp/Fnr family transcriptional regulator [Chryseobacterium chendengshani]|uniref:Crp/Fnr family transcriptional regulator n=1 Tax=unclassified Chryseobacterium TaxID=2593645 RepID=UPI001C6436F8|nr:MULTISPECIES: Crp/Fnr family transcriptional regulator [unclassified Chryseobacterium]MBW7674543.1 Crp/Fnr family transcriptional regulator [Chryseobacterium sp. LJ756]MBW8522664.1 Crp/Fnr family transcriptional regulator [Chryseobacterium sp. LJ668]QYK16200.1 Crp/Fnr family transcriptional regulator [Chryseobacterium sp. LJ668]
MKTISCTKLDEDLLKSFGGTTKSYNEGEKIFHQGDVPLYYYQIVEGKVKENNQDGEGREFIHNILGAGQSFGDSMLFIDKRYPINAEAITDCRIIKLPKENFLNLLEKHPETSVQINSCMSQRMHYQFIMMQNLASNDPVIRLTGLLEYLKSFHSDDIPLSFQIQLTRQQIANLTGLRVETVIRTIKKMETANIVKIDKRKIFF